MTSSEIRIGEAVRALTAVFEREQIDGAARKAHDFVTTELLHQGWRPDAAPAAYRPQPGGDRKADEETRKAAIAKARAALREEA